VLRCYAKPLATNVVANIVDIDFPFYDETINLYSRRRNGKDIRKQFAVVSFNLLQH
jgi:hypothetical protein